MNIVNLLGAGVTSKGVRFIVLERLDGGTLTQMLGYDTRIRDRRRRFWRKKNFSYSDVLKCARSIASAMTYCQQEAIPDCMVLHRDLKPDNIGFTLNGTVKVIDFGLAKIVEHGSVESTDTYEMSGETGSLRYMAPEGKNSILGLFKSLCKISLAHSIVLYQSPIPCRTITKPMCTHSGLFYGS